uniref:Uncharacterized protein LOC100180855 n=1 Tax=Phallusia mammillata TaxID=59560 RepID=A0A6F9DI27_9ASCI|nr:uncharacterized protein LOC100180855 [Phallusia mammillata]
MKVLLAYDGSANADKAFEWYFKNLHKDCYDVKVFSHVDKPDIPTSLFGGVPVLMYEEVQMMIKEHREKCLKLTEELNTKCKAYGEKIIAEVETTDEGAGHAICRHATDFEADLIVTGTRGQGKVRRTILGSVSDYVIHHSKIPITVCH